MYGRRNILEFDPTTLAFHAGTNTTIRRFGSGLVPGGCNIYAVTKEADGSKDGRFLYRGKITNIQIFQFDKIPHDLVRIHHNCNSFERLYPAIVKYYKDFRQAEIVQVISFKVFFND